MREAIQKVMEAEGEARRIVDAAHAESERMLLQARQEAEERVASARREARLESEGIRATAEQDALREKQSRLERASRECTDGIRIDDARRVECVQCVVDVVLGNVAREAG